MNINEVILTVMIAGFGFNFALMYIIWSNLNAKIEKLETRLDRLEQRVDNINQRLIVIETMLHMKDCCLLKSDQSIKKAE